MRIFVTGATGFIGSHLVRRLLEDGHDVTALVHRARPSLPRAARAVEGDVLRPDAYREALAASDAALHLAALYRIGPVDRRRMYAVNVEGTRTFLDTAIQAGVGRIIHVSSTAALGETFGREPDESHRHNGVFRSYYEETKHVAHGLALQRAARGAPVAIAVPGGVFGLGDRSVVAATVRDFCRGKVPVQIETTSRFQLCEVSRVCDGLVRVLERGTLGESYLLTGKSLSLPELFALMAAAVGRPPPRPVATRWLAPAARLCDALGRLGLTLPLSRETLQTMDGSTYTYSSDKARATLGWQAGDFEHDFTDYMRQAGFLPS